MLKDLSGLSEEPELAPECCANGQPGETERGCAHFRASLWLGIAADIRRKRASREMKGQVSC
jgi:hypothetical protein